MARYPQHVVSNRLNRLSQVGGSLPTFQIHRDRMIVFSRMYKGLGDRYDAFRPTAQTYDAALQHYYEQGYTLINLGDAEALWFSSLHSIIKAHSTTFELEAKFHYQNRYHRILGYFDHLWQHATGRRVEEWLAPLYGGESLGVNESLSFRVLDGNTDLGTCVG